MDMIDLKRLEIWFITGSQHLYGPETLETGCRPFPGNFQGIEQCRGDSRLKCVFKPVLKSPEEVFALCEEANQDRQTASG